MSRLDKVVDDFFLKIGIGLQINEISFVGSGSGLGRALIGEPGTNPDEIHHILKDKTIRLIFFTGLV